MKRLPISWVWLRRAGCAAQQSGSVALRGARAAARVAGEAAEPPGQPVVGVADGSIATASPERPGAERKPARDRSRARVLCGLLSLRGLTTLLTVLGLSGAARAGVPECHNLRLEDITSGGCELRASADCHASCDRLGVYKKACATQLHQVCRQDCTLSADATCTDSCTVTCKSECDRGVSITCQHNCYGECSGSCDAKCEGAADAAQCHASCEATCDGECDVRCRPVVDASCYTHCIECCGGSCTAQANMDCQTTCQDEQFETCEHELEIDCSGSCQVEGALFCNGEYILSGPDLADCVRALIARGTLEASAEVDGRVTLGGPGDNLGGGCNASNVAAPGGAAGAGALGLLAWVRRRSRRPSKHPGHRRR